VEATCNSCQSSHALIKNVMQLNTIKWASPGHTQLSMAATINLALTIARSESRAAL